MVGGDSHRSSSSPQSSHRLSGESMDQVGPLPPSPLRLEGYLKKLKSEEGTFAGGIFQRSKFNKRWFSIEEVVTPPSSSSSSASSSGIGHLYSLNYWKVASEAASKLPSFELYLDQVIGCDQGVGRGPYTREEFTFHVETAARTYVLTAASREEMLWWIQGINYYVWTTKQTRERMLRRESGAISPPLNDPIGGGIVSSTPNDAFGVAPSNRRRSLPLAELGSPASSSDGSLTGGSPDTKLQPLPSFSPIASEYGPDGKMIVELRDFERTGNTPLKPSAGVMESQELEGKYHDDDDDEGVDMVHENAFPLSQPPSTSLESLALSKPPPPMGELSSPIRFGHEDVVTARPPNDTNRTSRDKSDEDEIKTERSMIQPQTLDSNRSDDPFGSHDTDRRPAATIPSAYPSLDSNRSLNTLDSRPPHRDLDELLSRDDLLLADASAPPQTERSGVVQPSPPTTSNKINRNGQQQQHPPTNPHIAQSNKNVIDSDADDNGHDAADAADDDDDPFNSNSIDLGATAASGFQVVQGGSLDPDTERDPFEDESGTHESAPPTAAAAEEESEIPEENDLEQHTHEDDDGENASLTQEELSTVESHDEVVTNDETHEPDSSSASDRHADDTNEKDDDDDDDEEDHIIDALADSESLPPPTISQPIDDVVDHLNDSLDPHDESILNGSTMLTESIVEDTSHVASQRKKVVPFDIPRLRPRQVLPPIVPASTTPAAVAVVAPSTINPSASPNSSPTSFPPTPMEIAAAISSIPSTAAGGVSAAQASPSPDGTSAAAATSSRRRRFEPSNTHTCHTAMEFSRLRMEVRDYGLDRLIADQVAEGWFRYRTNDDDTADGVGLDRYSDIVISNALKPFNPFSRLVTGLLSPPYEELLPSFGLEDLSQEFMVARNRPECEQHWSSEDVEWLGKASMGERHQFLLIRPLEWRTFNVTTFGMGYETDLYKHIQALKSSIELLDRMESTARLYTRAAGWSKQLGLYFHPYPFNSVQVTICTHTRAHSMNPTLP